MLIIETLSWKRCLALIQRQGLAIFVPGYHLSLRDVWDCCTFPQVLATSLHFTYSNKTVVAWQSQLPVPLALAAVVPRATGFKMQNDQNNHKVSLGQ